MFEIADLNSRLSVWAKKWSEKNLIIVRPSPELSYHCQSPAAQLTLPSKSDIAPPKTRPPPAFFLLGGGC